MTRAQIEDALTVAGFNTGEWVSLGDSFKYLLMHSDKNSFNDDSAVQYYFSDNYNYVLMRYLMGRPTATTELASVPSGYVKVYHNSQPYLVQVQPGGVEDGSADAAGVYHNITSFYSIVGLFNR